MINKRVIYGLGVIGLIVAGLFIRSCKSDHRLPQAFNTPLAPDTVAQVIVSDRHIAVRTDKSTQATYIPDGGRVNVTINKTGVVQLDVQTAGFTFKPVVGGLITDRLRGALGVEVAYWNRLELYGGVGVPHAVGFVGLGYRLDQVKWLENTSLTVSFDTQKQIGFGLVVHF